MIQHLPNTAGNIRKKKKPSIMGSILAGKKCSMQKGSIEHPFIMRANLNDLIRVGIILSS